MSDDARKRARLVLFGEPGVQRSSLAQENRIIDAMLQFANERLEEAAHRLYVYGYVQPAGEVRSFKSTPPKPPETREQRLERALREIAAADFPRLGGIHGLIALAKDALDEARTEES